MFAQKADKTLDIKGLVNPRAAFITGHTLANMGRGEVLRVVTDDVRTKQSIPELCRGSGYELLELREERGTLYFTIRK